MQLIGNAGYKRLQFGDPAFKLCDPLFRLNEALVLLLERETVEVLIDV